jgi:hypothetical protein
VVQTEKISALLPPIQTGDSALPYQSSSAGVPQPFEPE